MGNASLTALPASPVRTPATPEQYNDIINALLGMLIIRDPTTGLETDGAYDIGEVANGRPRNIYITGDIIKQGQIINVGVPIGVAFPYFANIPGVATLPDNFQECNGQQITDVRSAMYGQYMPNINTAKRFVRGGATAGVTQANQIKSHLHGLTAAGAASHTHAFTGTVANHSHNPGTLASDTAANHTHDTSINTQTRDDVPGGGVNRDIWQSHGTGPSGAAGTHSHAITGGATAGATPSCSGTTGAPSTTALTGNTDVTAAGSPDETAPDNITAVYVMRIF